MKRVHVCSQPGCPNLAPCPTPGHTRPKNAHWSKDRDRQAQHHFRVAVLERDNYTCTRCHHHDPTGRTLEAHHDTPTTGRTLCNSKANGCHAAIDKSAR